MQVVWLERLVLSCDVGKPCVYLLKEIIGEFSSSSDAADDRFRILVGLWSNGQTLDFPLDYGAMAKLRIFRWIMEQWPNFGFSVGLWSSNQT